MKTGILLVNTGSPDSPHPENVKKYLKEFLMDERVIDIPEWQRKILVNWIIAPRRAAKSGALYEKIWTENGSPLIETTRLLAQELQKHTHLESFYAMRYGKPDIKSALSLMEFKGIQKVIYVPLFPHYAMSTTESAVERMKRELVHYSFKEVAILPPWFEKKEYIQALIENARPFLKKKPDAIVLSYHSLPVRHILKSDTSGSHCLKTPDCCSKKNPVQKYCYRYQTMQTTRLFTNLSEMPKGTIIHSYQSALNKKKWIGPDTEEEILRLAKAGKKHIAVMCPGFAVDNLETLEEIAIRAKNIFLENGGEKFTYIPALNTSRAWIKALSKWIMDEAKKK